MLKDEEGDDTGGSRHERKGSRRYLKDDQGSAEKI